MTLHEVSGSLLVVCICRVLSTGLHHMLAQWLRHCATNRKFAWSIPDGVIGIFHWHNPSGRTMALGSASNRNEYQEYFLGVKAAGAQGWQPCHLHVSIVLKSRSLNLLETSGTVKTCNGIALPFTFYCTRCACFPDITSLSLNVIMAQSKKLSICS
jgi:hypothetical protein